MPTPGITVVSAHDDAIPEATVRLLTRCRGLTGALITSDPEEPLPSRLLGIASRLHDELAEAIPK